MLSSLFVLVVAYNVIKVEEYPKGLTGEQMLNYPRICTVMCSKCSKVKEKQPYD